MNHEELPQAKECPGCRIVPLVRLDSERDMLVMECIAEGCVMKEKFAVRSITVEKVIEAWNYEVEEAYRVLSSL